MRYYLAVIVEPGSVWTETFGSTSKSDVDYEVQTWKDQDRHCARFIHRKTFQHVPTQAEVEAFAHQF